MRLLHACLSLPNKEDKYTGHQYLYLSPVLLCGRPVVLVCAVLPLPGAVISHGSAGGDQVDATAHPSYEVLVIVIPVPVTLPAYHLQDPVQQVAAC